MTMRSWVRNLFARPATRPLRKAPHRSRPALEALEDRTVPSTGLVGFWQADNSTADSTGNNNGTLVGGAGYGAGVHGQAFNFSGSNSVALPGSVNGPLDVTGTGLTVGAWINLNTYASPNGNQAIFDKYFSGGFNGYMLGVANDGHLTGFLSTSATGSSFFSFDGGVAVGLNTWAYVAMTYDGAAARLYVNGTQTASVPLTGAITHNAFDAAIGNDNGGSTAFGLNGRIDNVSVWNRALSASELATEVSLVVTTDQDVVDPTDGLTSLREAIDVANAISGPNTITFGDGSGSGGTNFLDATPDTITLTSGQLTLNDSATTTTISGPGAGLLSVSGNNTSRVFQINGLVTASISGMTITGGSAVNGGGLYNVGNVTLADCTVSGNAASNAGGGLANRGTATLTNCTVSGNSAFNAGGGVVNYFGTATLTDCTVSGNSTRGFGGGVFNRFSKVTLTNTTLSDNSAGFGGGGMINSEGTATLTATLTNCTISGNTAPLGGGLYNAQLRAAYPATTTLTNCTVSGNSATTGGGIANTGTLNVDSSRIINNQATSKGGGIATTGGSVTIANSVINSNQVTSSGTALGGGIDCENSVLSLTNCTVNANQANGVTALGGGIYALNSTVDIKHSVVNGNKANGSALGEGGGIYRQGGNLTLLDSIVKGNKATTDFDNIFS